MIILYNAHRANAPVRYIPSLARRSYNAPRSEEPWRYTLAWRQRLYNAHRTNAPVRYMKWAHKSAHFLCNKKSTSSVAFVLSSGKMKGHPLRWPFHIIRHLASFPQSSIIAATRLDFCVRNGNRYFPRAMDTEERL